MKLDEKTLIGIEDYIQVLDENVGLKIETIKDIAQAINKHRGLVKKLTIPVVTNSLLEQKVIDIEDEISRLKEFTGLDQL